ncbi:hypothetical protein VM1G_11989 [Cytospora mali]|uniref:Uncharacterized protein n=1 Tax=Cytospora mali TaxID=578113 RepID=A0A194VHH1_CYTMA|nr:hypothetical protein VM1G_11989 [Valsa mali]
MASLRPAPSMRRPMFFTLPSVAGLAFKRLMASKAREYSSKPTKPTKGPVIKPISNRFPPLIPGPMIIVKTVQLPPSPGSVKIPAHKESPAPMEAKPSTAPEDYHVIDIYMRNGWRWLFPRGQCPEVPWWHPALKPAESSAADLRWTSGVMYRSFWKRVRTVLGVSVIASSLPATAIAQGVIMIAEGPVSTAMYLGIFAAVALPGLFDSRFDAKDAYYLGKRVIGLENDVIRTGELAQFR